MATGINARNALGSKMLLFYMLTTDRLTFGSRSRVAKHFHVSSVEHGNNVSILEALLFSWLS